MLQGVTRLLARSRYVVILAVLGSFISSVTLFVYGITAVFNIVRETLGESGANNEGTKSLQLSFIELTDVFLLGTVLYIVAVGLYQLFIQSNLPVPTWLKINNLDELTVRLVEVVGVLLSVTFLAFAVKEGDNFSLLELGVSVGIVIAALSLLLIVSHRRLASDQPTQSD